MNISNSGLVLLITEQSESLAWLRNVSGSSSERWQAVAVALVPAKPSHLTKVAGFVAYLHYNKAERVSSLRVAFSYITGCGDMSLMLLLLHSRLDDCFQVLGGLAVCFRTVPAVSTGALLPLRQSVPRNPPP